MLQITRYIILLLIFYSIIDSGSKRLATAIRDFFTTYEARLSSLLEGGTISKFATEMHQANLICRPVDPSYHTIVDKFMIALQFLREQREIEQQCSTFFQTLYGIGGPLKNASETMRKELVQNVKSRLNIDLNLKACLEVQSRHGKFNQMKCNDNSPYG